VSAERFELSTNGLKGHCSAIELRAQLYRFFQQKNDLLNAPVEVGFNARSSEVCGTSESGLHSNMGNIHRQRKTPCYNDVYQYGGTNG
jgi:hypothetical protein